MRIEHIRKFEQGQQGITGLARVDDTVCVYKISQFLNYLPEHEYDIARALERLSLPHFCKAIDLRTVPINPRFRVDEVDPFSDCVKPVHIGVLFLEYVEGVSFMDHIADTAVPMNAIMSIVKQVMVSVLYAQQTHFAHYDLHSYNILIQKSDENVAHLYLMNDRDCVLVHTHGFVPVIIDYGFATVDDIQDKPIRCSMGYTDAGYLSPAFDPFADFKIFLVSVAADMKASREEDPEHARFGAIVQNLFQPLSIDWHSGWDTGRKAPLIDVIFEYVENVNETSPLMRRYPHFCMDILQHLVCLPLETRVAPDLPEMRKAFQIFVREFAKIEHEMQNMFYTIYVFRHIVDFAGELRQSYQDEQSREKAVTTFGRQVFETVRTVAEYCTLSKVDFDMMICALFVFQDHLEAQLKSMQEKLLAQKEREYASMRLTSPEHMFGVVDVNFPEVTEFTEDTTVRVFDGTSIRAEFQLAPKTLEEFNALKPEYRATFLRHVFENTL